MTKHRISSFRPVSLAEQIFALLSCISYPCTSNLAILSSLTSWVTQNHGVIHVAGTSHERVRQNANDVRETYEEFATHEEDQEIRVQNMYRIMDTVVSDLPPPPLSLPR